jgi:GntP family gluconate:H+ symporter
MLLALVVITIAGIFLGIIKFQLNPFVALIAAAIFQGLSSGMDPQVLVKSITAGMGGTLGFIGIVLGFGTMMGKLLAESGAADVLARRMIAVLGEERVNWAIAIVAFIVGISVFFQVGIVLLIPLLFTIARRTGVTLAFVVVPLLASLTTVQHYMPPHPAVMAIVPPLHADVSRTLLWGLLISLPCALVAGPFYGKWLSRRLVKMPTDEMIEKFCSLKVHDNPPGFFTSMFTMLLPIVLMLLSELADVLLLKGTTPFKLLKFLGDPSVALFLSFLVSLYTFGFARGFSRKTLNSFTTQCLGPVASILLIIGAGGAFGRILVESGVANEVSKLAANWQIPPLVFAWFVATMLRITVGSGSVSMITTAGLVAPMVTAGSVTPELMVMAIGAGGTGFSHVTDSGFWVVKEFFGLSIEETLRVWTVCSTVVSFIGLGIVCTLHACGY